MTRPLAEFEEVDRLIRWGMNDCAIARLTGIPRRTILDWRHGRANRHGGPVRRSDCPLCDDVELAPSCYAYLLGLYLGDGFISKHARGVFRLRIVLDRRYPGIIQEGARAITAVRSRGEMRVGYTAKIGCLEVGAYWKHWPCLFPQHGVGPKHLRKIELQPWQLEIVQTLPHRLLRGLIHSDGCRVLNRVNGKDYPRYQFCNHSEDVRNIFCRACDDYGVSWRYSNWHTISVSRRRDVARLDQVIGPKT